MAWGGGSTMSAKGTFSIFNIMPKNKREWTFWQKNWQTCLTQILLGSSFSEVLAPQF